MRVFSKLAALSREYKNIVVALGMFDGVHIGHQSIVRRAVELAREIDGTAVVFTFSNHPLAVVAPQALPKQIGNNLLRERRLAELGVDVLVSIPFTKEFASKSPKAFLELLQQLFAPRYVVTGPNYTFGSKGRGTQRQLLREGPAYGFQAEVCQAVLRDGRAVSSTRIRALVDKGALQEVNDFLGYPFTVVGRVIHGDRRGRTLGFPTANLAIPDERVMLPNGVYACDVIHAGRHYAGLANIGDNPTFEGCNRRLEVNIQDFCQDIYDQVIEVRFLAKLREQQKFAGKEELIAQMHRDRENARRYWRG
ncbi:riboflavin biosynthesis protein RibF [Selenomonas caprae]|uniref:Riboflavin biosynthesis protein n=1 Tax=Selenomonas caprae TaxID=2606905 RepID=A0A5D6WP58_9FIRM|nr:riboflavin biosynthesis protein RibF [Selenomonas caprae]TYZ29600.1 riboflavin biosynthesis protein RibF [Selenomonas caprae]